MLILQHSNGDSIDVETIEEVLDASTNDHTPFRRVSTGSVPLTRNIHSISLSQLDESLSHSLHYVSVSLQNHLQLVVEAAKTLIGLKLEIEFHNNL